MITKLHMRLILTEAIGLILVSVIDIESSFCKDLIGCSSYIDYIQLFMPSSTQFGSLH